MFHLKIHCLCSTAYYILMILFSLAVNHRKFLIWRVVKAIQDLSNAIKDGSKLGSNTQMDAIKGLTDALRPGNQMPLHAHSPRVVQPSHANSLAHTSTLSYAKTLAQTDSLRGFPLGGLTMPSFMPNHRPMGFPPQEVFPFYFLLFPTFLLNIIF